MKLNESQNEVRWKIRFRFTIRALLVIFAVITASCIWLSYPTRIATRYVNALKAKDFASANQLCIGEPIFPGEISYKFFEPNASIRPLTLDDLWRGQRQIIIAVGYGNGGGIASYGVNCTATHRGVLVDPMMMP